MKPFHEKDGIALYHGGCQDVLAGLPDGSVHCCVTSPPYWGLRDYGLSPSVWGGESATGAEVEWETEEGIDAGRGYPDEQVWVTR